MSGPDGYGLAGLPTHAHVRQATAAGIRAIVGGLLASAVLATLKILTGFAGNSYALVADGFESVLDIFSSLIVLATLRISAAPQSPRFPYGLGKAETLGAVVVATMLLLAAVGIAVQAVRELLVPHPPPAFFTLPVLVAVVLTKELLFRWLFATGSRVGSDAVQMDAWHHRSDALTSLAAFGGISVALVGGEGYESADDWAALAACGVIFFNGTRLFWRSLQDVLDVQARPAVERQVRSVARGVAKVSGVEICRVRRAGLTYLVDIHIEVDAGLTVRQGHDIAHEVKAALLHSSLPITDVLVHIEPALARGETKDPNESVY